MTALFTVTLTVDRPAGTDAYGNPLAGVTHTVDDCVVAPRGSPFEDNADHRDQIIDSLSVYAPSGADIKAQDVAVDPLPPAYTGRWQVQGDVAYWQSPFTGWQPGVEVILKRVEG